MQKIRWGILSTAKIAREKVIPAMHKGEFCEVVAIASRNLEQAETNARNLNIPRAFGSYEEMLSDPDIDAIYIPLPNHMHVEWAIKVLEANKHVLCEKPIGMSSADAATLLEASAAKPHLKVMEAFMYRFHPQWLFIKDLIDNKRIGELKNIQSFFSYYNVDTNNIRNKKEAGGGALMDIGCYCVSWSRWLFGEEPTRVSSSVDYDPQTGTDRVSTALLEFSGGVSSFTCSTQLVPYQRVNILGAEARIEVEIPVNAPPDKVVKVWVHSKTGTEERTFDPVDQYTLQLDSFSQSILNDKEVPMSLEESIKNMKVIEAVFESAEIDGWKNL